MKILIVEDERELAKSMIQYLRQESYVCETAYTAQEDGDNRRRDPDHRGDPIATC